MKGEKGKAPSIQWYYKDWLSDMKLQMSLPSTRGIWANILMFMLSCDPEDHQCGPGILFGVTYERLCYLGKCSLKEARLFVKEAKELRFCDIENEDKPNRKVQSFTIISRRLNRDIPEKQRLKNKWKNDKKRQRKTGDDNGNVHPNVHHDVHTNSTLSPPASPIPTPSTSTKSRSAGIFEFIDPKLLKRIGARWPKCYQWIAKEIKHNKNKNAILHILNRIDQTKDIKDYYGFVTEILKVENSNYNALEFDTQEAQRQQERLKQHLNSIGEKI